jgi:hypothetical protein
MGSYEGTSEFPFFDALEEETHMSAQQYFTTLEGEDPDGAEEVSLIYREYRSNFL